MGLGILKDNVMEHVPGTVFLGNGQEDGGPNNHNDGTKYDRSGATHVILVPQPSDDPDDPLNWPLYKRDIILLILSSVSVLATCLGSILAANTLILALWFRKTFTAIALLTGYHLCGVGVAGFLFVASARVWGKRHLYLLGAVLLVASTAWAGASRGSYKSLLWARIIQGVAVAPFEALVNVTVGDMYFVHQRGKRMALSNLALFGGAFFTPILVGKITYTLGWWWSFYLVTIFSAVMLPLVVFFVPETTYKRSAHLNTDMASTDDLNGAREKQTRTQQMGASSERPSFEATAERGAARADNSRSRKGLMPFNGRKSDESLLKLVLRPLPLFLHPAVLWGCLIQGALIGWTVLIGVCLAAVFLSPPLFFNEVQTGYMYSGAFIGALLGFIIAGLLSDWSARYMTRRNSGIYEPEFRILLVIPQLVFGCAGLYGFGITANNVSKYGWIGPEVCFAFVVMGMVIGAVASALYIVDAHRAIAVEAFTCLLLFKNMFSFALTWSAYNWIVRDGILDTFYAIASIQVVICLLSVPLYIFGKRNRSFFHRHDILKMLHLW